ncbi:MAG TPA: tyrosine-type recombinase/integrase [Dehalococcoidia bacterium]|nr:tyrosine-type recombinase/integrase [Dehalococcoidia bacterium]
MKGNIRKRGHNQGWQITIWTGRKPDGKPLRYYETVRGSKADAQRRLRELMTGMDKGTLPTNGKLTLGGLLAEWLSCYCKTSCSQRTQDSYQSIVKNHLTPIGYIKLKDLRHQVIQAHYGKLCENLSSQTVLHIHRVLSQALRWGVEQDYLSVNPAERVKPPPLRRRAMSTLSAMEVRTLIGVAQDSYYFPVILAGIGTGLRRNELLALRWRDVDLDALCLSVNQTLYKGNGRVEFKEPKTRYSRRRVSLPPKLGLYLRQYREERLILYRQLGTELGLDDLVFTNADGKPIDPSVLSHNFGRIVKKAGLNARFHDLRHSYASLLLAAGVHPKIVSEALGHSTVGITLDLYSHVVPGLQEAAVRKLDAVLPEAAERRGSVAVGRLEASPATVRL